MASRIRLEICVDSPAGVLAAVANGADRLELCSALALGGLTPSMGLMRLAAASGCEAVAMIRPRPGPFDYAGADLDVMRWEIDAARAAGLAGVVIGANRASGALDIDLLAELMAHAAGLTVTLHRAFDLAPDLDAALEEAVALGFHRVLTSGGARTAPQGVVRIAGLVVRAAGRISVMPGSGITPRTVAEVVRRTGAREVHGSCGTPADSAALTAERRTLARELGFISDGDRRTDAATVAVMAARLRALSDERAAQAQTEAETRL